MALDCTEYQLVVLFRELLGKVEIEELLIVKLLSTVTRFCSGAAPHFPMQKVLLLLEIIIGIVRRYEYVENMEIYKTFASEISGFGRGYNGNCENKPKEKPETFSIGFGV